MSGDESQMTGLDARLRRQLSGLDAAAGFEARVMARVAAQAAASGAVRSDLRGQFERRRELAGRRLRREAWANAVTIAGIGVAGVALVVRYAADLVRWIEATAPAGQAEPILIGAVTIAGVAAGLWPFLERAPTATR